MTRKLIYLEIKHADKDTGETVVSKLSLPRPISEIDQFFDDRGILNGFDYEIIGHESIWLPEDVEIPKYPNIEYLNELCEAIQPYDLEKSYLIETYITVTGKNDIEHIAKNVVPNCKIYLNTCLKEVMYDKIMEKYPDLPDEIKPYLDLYRYAKDHGEGYTEWNSAVLYNPLNV